MTSNLITPEAFRKPARLNESDAILVEQLKNGSQSALKQLYDIHGKKVYALCLRLSGEVDIAEDITQEVFVQVWQSIHKFKGESKFATWLHSLASNVAISHMRKQKPWWRSWFGSAEQNDMALQNIEYQDEQQDFSLSRSGLDKMIAQLPEQARIVFVLFAIEGWRHEEISKKLNIAVGSSKAQYHRAKQLLQQSLNLETAVDR